MTANTATKINETPIRTTILPQDRVVILSNNTTANTIRTATIRYDDFCSTLTLGSAPPSASPQSSSSFTVTAGRMWTDGTYVYVATADNHTKRFGPLSDF